MQRKDTRGFTLLELLLVVMIMGVIVSMSIPSFYNQFHQTNLKQDAMKVCQLINEAQQQAIANQKIITLKFDKNKNTFVLLFSTHDTISSAAEIKQVMLGSDINFMAGTLEGVDFHPSGVMGECRVILSQGEKQIVVSTQERINHVDVFEI